MLLSFFFHLTLFDHFHLLRSAGWRWIAQPNLAPAARWFLFLTTSDVRQSIDPTTSEEKKQIKTEMCINLKNFEPFNSNVSNFFPFRPVHSCGVHGGQLEQEKELMLCVCKTGKWEREQVLFLLTLQTCVSAPLREIKPSSPSGYWDPWTHHDRLVYGQ